MNATDVMTSNVISVGPDAVASEIAEIMLANGISGVPVLGERGELVGIISEGDLMRTAERAMAPRRSWWLALLAGKEAFESDCHWARSRRAADVMTHNVITASPDTPVSQIARLLERHSIKRVPIVSDRRVVGVVSRADLVKAVANIPSGVVWG
jgi:CBS domain-containing protein